MQNLHLYDYNELSLGTRLSVENQMMHFLKKYKKIVEMLKIDSDNPSPKNTLYIIG
jgi:hypothetical protein